MFSVLCGFQYIRYKKMLGRGFVEAGKQLINGRPAWTLLARLKVQPGQLAQCQRDLSNLAKINGITNSEHNNVKKVNTSNNRFIHISRNLCENTLKISN